MVIARYLNLACERDNTDSSYLRRNLASRFACLSAPAVLQSGRVDLVCGASSATAGRELVCSALRLGRACRFSSAFGLAETDMH